MHCFFHIRDFKFKQTDKAIINITDVTTEVCDDCRALKIGY